MEKSEQINELAAALSKAQAAMANPKKSAENPFFKMKYATLDEVWDVVRKPLTDNHLSIVQSPEKEGQDIGITTMLLHSTGQYITSKLVVTPKGQDVQSAGSAITYARRYSLMSILGIAPEDDDGEQAMNREKKSSQKLAARTEPVKNSPPKPETTKIEPPTTSTSSAWCSQPGCQEKNGGGKTINLVDVMIDVKGVQYSLYDFSMKKFGRGLCPKHFKEENLRVETEKKDGAAEKAREEAEKKQREEDEKRLQEEAELYAGIEDHIDDIPPVNGYDADEPAYMPGL